MPRPDAATYASLISTLETQIDTAAAVKPNPGVRTFQRLNRPEYARSIHDLLGARRRRRQLAAARHQERELRQYRRRAGALADAARVVPERGGGDQPHGGRRSQRADDRRHLHGADLHLAASVGSRRGRALRHARRHRRDARVPGGRGVRLRSRPRVGDQRALRGHRHLDRRRARGAHRIRDRSGGRRRRTRRGADAHRTGPRESGAAQSRRGVRQAAGRSVRGSDPAARLVVRRRRIGRTAASRRCRT